MRSTTPGPAATIGANAGIIASGVTTMFTTIETAKTAVKPGNIENSPCFARSTQSPHSGRPSAAPQATDRS
jgi:hypothetical protein